MADIQKEVPCLSDENEIDNIYQNIPVATPNTAFEPQDEKYRSDKMQAANISLAEELPLHRGGFKEDNAVQHRQLATAIERDVNTDEIEEDVRSVIEIQPTNSPLSEEIPLNRSGFKNYSMVQNTPATTEKASFAELQGEKQRDAIGPLAEVLPINRGVFEIDHIVQNRQLAAVKECDANIGEIQEEVQPRIQHVNAPLGRELPLNPRDKENYVRVMKRRRREMRKFVNKFYKPS